MRTFTWVTRLRLSWVAIHVMKNVIQAVVWAWNSHRIPGPEGGVSDTLSAQNNHITPRLSHVIPSTQETDQIHKRDGLCLQGEALILSMGPHSCSSFRERERYMYLPRFGCCFQDIISWSRTPSAIHFLTLGVHAQRGLQYLVSVCAVSNYTSNKRY